MKSLQTYRMEHQSLLDHMTRVHQSLDLAHWKQGHTHVQQLLSAIHELKDEVVAHAHYEDRDFYPWVRALSQPQVIAQIEGMRDDLFPIDRAFDAFFTLWPPRQILDNLDEFNASLRELTELLNLRIQSEEEIFRLLDRLGLEP